MVGSTYGLPGAGWFMNFSLLSADRQAEVVAGLYELVNAMLHVGFRGSIDGTVISKQKIIDGAYLHLGFRFEPPEVEE